MNILIAPNNFKESIDAHAASQAIEKGLLNSRLDCGITLLPLSDGGEGFVNALVNALNGKLIHCNVKDPLARSMDSYYGKLSDDTAVVEMALASGLELISESEKNPLLTTSYGTGELIRQAITDGFRNIIIGIGGSATNDAGMGMLQALGVDFYDQSDNLITSYGAKELMNVVRLDVSKIKNLIKGVSFTVACDVTNPLLGTFGATYIYGPQKGANANMLTQLEKGVANFASLTEQTLHVDFKAAEGAGAAGGMGYALLSYLNATLKSGFSIVAEHTNLYGLVPKMNLVITGEGKIDHQTSQGKVISRLGHICKQSDVPLIAIGGKLEEGVLIEGVKEYYEISKLAKSKEDAMKNAAHYLEQIGSLIGERLNDCL